MPLRDTSTEYGGMSRFNHWVGATIVLTMLIIGLYFHEMPRGEERSYWLGLHIGIGILSFLFIAYRVFWRLLSRSPESAPQSRMMQRISKLTHWLLLTAITIMFITGPLLIWSIDRPLSPFGLFSIPSPLGEMRDLHEWLEDVHKVTSRVVLTLVGIHILAVIKHLILNPSILRGRMWGSRY